MYTSARVFNEEATMLTSSGSNRPRAALAIAGIAAALVIAGCSSSSTTSRSRGASDNDDPSRPFLVYANMPQTGPIASVAGAAIAGSKLAVKDINASGGILGHQVELVVS